MEPERELSGRRITSRRTSGRRTSYWDMAAGGMGRESREGRVGCRRASASAGVREWALEDGMDPVAAAWAEDVVGLRLPSPSPSPLFPCAITRRLPLCHSATPTCSPQTRGRDGPGECNAGRRAR